MQLTTHIKKHKISILIFIISIIIGLFIFKDYGMSWDDKIQRTIGLETYNYIFHGDKCLKTYIHRDYGVAFELPLVIFEKILGFSDTRNIYLMRHLVTHLFFLVSAFVLYLLIYVLYKNRILGIIGYLILLLTPPIYAQSFFNSKDIPFMSMFIICFFLYELAFQKWKTRYFLFFGISTGLLMNLRLMGIMFLIFVSVFMIIEKISAPDKKNIWKFYLLYLITSFATLIATWPYLWENPIGNFVKAFSHFSNFESNYHPLMFGEFINPGGTKWYYIPVWFSITTSIPFIIAGLVGTILLISNLLKTPLKFISDLFSRNQLMYFFCFFGSIAAVIILHSNLYNGWRHMYFIYSSFILLTIYGISFILKIRNRYFRIFSSLSGALILTLTFINLFWYMIRNHPFQVVYFNNFLPHNEQYLKNNFEMDYTGYSHKQLLEYVLKNNSFNNINVFATYRCCKQNAMLLKKEDRERLVFVPCIKNADYFISIYHDRFISSKLPDSIKVFNIKVLNSDIGAVWKLK
jgi:hypothetical protein